MQCPTLAKTWFTLANWCYKWGRKAVDNATYVLLDEVICLFINFLDFVAILMIVIYSNKVTSTGKVSGLHLH